MIGPEDRILHREEITGRYDFVLIGRSQQESRAVLGAAYTGISQTFLAIEAQAGEKIIKWPAMIERMLSDVLHFDHPENFMAEGAVTGPLLSPIETLFLVVAGHKVRIDPRQDFQNTMPQTIDLAQQMVDRLESDERKRVLDYLARFKAAAERFIAEKKAALEAQQEKQAPRGPQTPAISSNGGGNNLPIGVGQRDGQGFNADRQLSRGQRGGDV